MIDNTNSITGMSGPAAIAAALGTLENHVQRIIQTAISKHELRGDVASTIASMHDSLARVLDDLSRTYGADATNIAAEYAASALDAGLIYPGAETEQFIREITESVRATSRDLAKSTGSVAT